MSYNKSERIIVVLEVVKRNQPIATSDVVREVALHYVKRDLENSKIPASRFSNELHARVDKAIDEFKVVVRSDLRDLKEFGFIDTKYYSLTNEPLDPKALKSEQTYNIVWSLKGEESKVHGANLLDRFQAAIFSDPAIAHELRVDYFLGTPTPGFINMIFSVGPAHLNVTLNQEESNLLLVVGRTTDPMRNPIEEDRDSLPGKNKRRVSALVVPPDTLSAYRSRVKPGHFAVQIHDSTSADIFDLDSSNGTWGKTIDSADVDRFVATMGRTKTRQAAAKDHPLSTSGFVAVAPGKARRFRLPLIVKASENFHMLIVAPPPR